MTLSDALILTIESFRFLILNIIKDWNFIYDAYLPMIFDNLFA